jgi:hypothetical protein
MSQTSPEKHVSKLSADEKLKLVNWMFSLPMQERLSLAQRHLAKAYPTAPEEMLLTARFHLYVDGADAVLDWLAETARFLQSADESPPNCGTTYHLLYHVYNWWQFESILPSGKLGLKEMVKEIHDLIEEGDPKTALGHVKILEEMIEGNVDVPKIDPC